MIKIPQEAYDAGRAAGFAWRAGTGSLAYRAIINAAAPLIVAAEMERLAEEIRADKPRFSSGNTASWMLAHALGIAQDIADRAAELREGVKQ